MGASGSGKTTLLTSLAGQLPAAKGMELHGVITVNGKPHATSTHRQAFVAQEDIFYSQLTVRCALTDCVVSPTCLLLLLTLPR
jgi:ABC-type multidrug transport system ATPase subunit